MRCPSCQKENPDDSSYCGYCGKLLNSKESSYRYLDGTGFVENKPQPQIRFLPFDWVILVIIIFLLFLLIISVTI